MTTSTSRPRHGRGFTLIEVLVALVLLLVGVLGLMRLQLVGFHANQGARVHTQAVELGRELALGLQALPWSDGRVSATGSAGTSAPSGFGRYLDSATPGNFHVWDDGSPVPGARLDSQITERDSDGTPTFKRRWSVWEISDGTGRPAGGRLIAVSVVFHERTSSIPYEVVYYGYQGNGSTAIANAGAYQ
jgi:type IV pilus assembly protein PilV